MNKIEFNSLIIRLKNHGVEVGDSRYCDEIIENHNDGYHMVRGYIEVQEVDSEQLKDVFGGHIVHIIPNSDSYIQVNIYHEVKK